MDRDERSGGTQPRADEPEALDSAYGTNAGSSIA
jgi:hypothetical protein